MVQGRNHYSNCFFVFLLPIFILLILAPSVCAEWTYVTPPTVSEWWDLKKVHFTSANEGWAVGEDMANSRGILLHYHEGIWESIAPPIVSGEWDLQWVHFTSANEGWAVGEDYENGRGVLLHYQEGIWISVIPPDVSVKWDLRGVHFTSANEGWAVGEDNADLNDKGVLLHYVDGVWGVVIPPIVSMYWSLYNVHFTSANEGWAVGIGIPDGGIRAGVLLHYYGGNWESITPPTLSGHWRLSAVHFPSSEEGWAVGEDYENGRGVLLHYQGGIWESVSTPTLNTQSLGDVYFTSANEGWAVGGDTLLNYQGGIWTAFIPTFSLRPGLNGVHFTSANEGWAVGFASNETGTLLHFVSDTPTKYKIKVKKAKKNKGDGTVTSNDGNIDCGESCSYKYYKDTVITLSAEANEGSTFIGWMPDKLGCTATDPCTVTIDKAKTVRAIFVGDYALKVVNKSKKGGTGTVTSTPVGISCSTGSTTDCIALYGYGGIVTLSALADSGSVFVGWAPAKMCPGIGDCLVPMDKKQTIKAVFSGQ